jgi:GNAT superfamily N-acetyltransferase
MGPPDPNLPEIPLVVRPYSPETDEGFVYDTWIKSYADACSTGHPLRRNPAYCSNMRARIRMVLARESRCLVAAWADDPTVFLAWGCAEDDVIHFVYVKKPYRRQGIGRLLVSKLVPPVAPWHVKYTHQTPAVMEMWLRDRDRFRYVGLDIPAHLEYLYDREVGE